MDMTIAFNDEIMDGYIDAHCAERALAMIDPGNASPSLKSRLAIEEGMDR